MDIEIVQVPYDSGHRGARMGAGPLRLVAGALPEQLSGRGHHVRLVSVELQAELPTEIAAAFQLARAVRERVAEARGRGALPLILAGNCVAALGVLAALERPRVFWFDAHGDLNTPETTHSGFLDGMALAIALGRCWNPLRVALGLEPLPAERVWLLGARDLDPAEREFLAVSAVHTSLDDVASSGEGATAYLHIDLDVLDPSVAPANRLAAPDGLELAELESAIERIGHAHRIAAASLTAYDPAVDPEGAMVAVAGRIADRIAAAAAGRS